MAIFTEGGPGVGLGHATRCAALAAAFLEEGREVVCHVDGPACIKTLFPVGCAFGLGDWAASPSVLSTYASASDICVIDSYGPTESFLELSFPGEGHPRLLFLDDTDRIRYPSGTLVNGSPGAASLYPTSQPGMRYLLGPAYQPLRREFWDCAPRRTRETVASAILTVGGDDVRGLLPVLLPALGGRFRGIRFTVVASSHSRSLEAMRTLVRGAHELIVDPDAGVLRRLLEDADVGICAAGQTLFELACTGLPAIAILTADNQKPNAAHWQASGFLDEAIPWDDPRLPERAIEALERYSDPMLRGGKSKIGASLIDGQGARRVARCIAREDP